MRKLACFLTLAFCSAACVAPAHADEVFQYAGNPLSESSCDGVCAFQIDISTSDVFNGVISFATPLAPNLSDVDVASDVDSFNFGAAFGGSSFYGSLIVSTDQNGDLSAWTININTLVGGGGILDPLSIANVISSAGDSQSESGSSFGYVPCYTIGCFPEGFVGGTILDYNTQPGVFTLQDTAATPEPASGLLVTTGAISLATLLRRKHLLS
jgi:hypothetical protein